MEKQVGKTRDAGWQMGLQKTFAISFDHAWDFMFSEEGLDIWLGTMPDPLSLHQSFLTKDGIEGKVTVFKHHSHIRMRWKKSDWINTSTLQVRVIKKGDKSTISFHQEKLMDKQQRMMMLDYWREKMQAISVALHARYKLS